MSAFMEEADKLLAAGWRQCSTFIPNAVVGNDRGLSEGAILVVMTQACTVVGNDLAKDPHIEVAVATPAVGKFNPRHQDSTGKNGRKLCVCFKDGEADAPYNIDINSRFTFPREKLLEFSPDGPQCRDEDVTRIANWVARYYNRTALPNLLVIQLGTAKVQDAISKLLRAEFGASPLHEEVHSVYGAWEPDDESGPYRFEIVFIVRSIDAMDELRARLAKSLGIHEHELMHKIDGVEVQFEVLVYDQVTLAELDDRLRISEWDLLSGLMEQA
ncbi:hypothetical protein HGO34_15150 [Agrobacterium vitis]|uniref:Uncharacterized protein n=1 Tax=Agrobacterium vitis TaxID=373 RepID=A0AAE4WCR6_AGRVI|nr:hypothetical protein [Agrobacterium vitis]MCF1499038.1 hypothetical protein [Allorhizobium sp. Av2]MCM2441056.1 hypothetical protein [Agrobacterium vitis]MUZ58486.1 hypothetical protein [Agrobacterium vitis]MVA65820.1 hypothetical protein [Agrobacterium vitis]MVA88158.1 hypothetical protein [Agrobacterium vitis]